MAAVTSRAVKLNVYNLTPHNGWLRSLGAGVYHSSVEISGREYHFSDQGILVTTQRPYDAETLHETVELGAFDGSTNEISGVVNRLRGEFPPGSYNLAARNCNHFSEAFCRALLGVGLPAYVNRMASVASWLPGGRSAKAAAGEDAMDEEVKEESRDAGKRKRGDNERPTLSAKQQAILTKLKTKA